MSHACPASRRDDDGHAWRFDGDEPYIVCEWCAQCQDALTGRVIIPGRTEEGSQP